jgi:hypothetical protein
MPLCGNGFRSFALQNSMPQIHAGLGSRYGVLRGQNRYAVLLLKFCYAKLHVGMGVLQGRSPRRGGSGGIAAFASIPLGVLPPAKLRDKKLRQVRSEGETSPFLCLCLF